MQTQIQEEMVLDPSLRLYLPLYKRDGVQFISDDACGHLCTVTGATWGLQGRTFDGDDFIEITAPSLNFTSGAFSILAWLKTTNLTADNAIFTRGEANVDGYELWITSTGAIGFRTNQAVSQVSATDAGSVVTGTYYLLGVTRLGASGKIYRNGVDITSSSGTHIDPLTCARTVKIGIRDDKTTADLVGQIGEVLICNRALTPLEIQRIYLQTKWRYQ